MSSYKNICNRLAELIPEKTREKKIFPNLNYAGVEKEFDFYLGRFVLVGLLFGLIGFLVPIVLLKETISFYLEFDGIIASGVVLGLLLLGITFLLEYLAVFYAIESRKKRVELIFPDFLLLVASNLDAGMTPYSAFKSAARPEFEPLTHEIKLAASKSLGTGSFTDALNQISKKIKSRVITETISFFARAIHSGGKLSKMLVEAATGIRRIQEQKQEIMSTTKMYVLFIIFIIVLASPVLFSLSVQFIEMMAEINQDAPTTISGQLSFLGGQTTIDAGFMFALVSVVLLCNAFLSSLFLGIIERGKAKLGLKYFPAFFVISYIIFIFSKSIFSVMVGAAA